MVQNLYVYYYFPMLHLLCEFQILLENEISLRNKNDTSFQFYPLINQMHISLKHSKHMHTLKCNADVYQVILSKIVKWHKDNHEAPHSLMVLELFFYFEPNVLLYFLSLNSIVPAKI